MNNIPLTPQDPLQSRAAILGRQCPAHPMPPTPTYNPEAIARQAQEALHEYFESVRSDVLAVPDSDVTLDLILSAMRQAVKESGVVEALREIRNSAGEQVMVCTREGHSFCVHTANAALANPLTYEH
jgi:hypothetical protein